MGKLLFGTLELEVESKGPPEIQEQERGLPLIHGERPELWFPFQMPNRLWRLAWVSADTMKRANNGADVYAVSYMEEGVILFDRVLKKPKNRALLNVVFLHEINHVGFHRVGESWAPYFGRTAAAASIREESVCTAHSDALANPLFAAGILRLPRWRK